jgi:hypothetical protein
MSAHDRGTFGKLLADAETLGMMVIRFEVDLARDAEDSLRWIASSSGIVASGRTGEEALRKLVSG